MYCKQTCPLHRLVQHGTTIQLVLHAPCFAAQNTSCLGCIASCIVLTLDTDMIVSSSGALEKYECQSVPHLPKRNENGLLDLLSSSLDMFAFIKQSKFSLCAHEWAASLQNIPTLSYLTICRSGCHASRILIREHTG